MDPTGNVMCHSIYFRFAQSNRTGLHKIKAMYGKRRPEYTGIPDCALK